MKIPPQVRIGPHVYTVTIDDEPAHRNKYGEADPMGMRIRIDENVPTSRMEETFIHEVIEVVNMEYELDLDHHTIVVLANTIYEFIQENPEVFRKEGK